MVKNLLIFLSINSLALIRDERKEESSSKARMLSFLPFLFGSDLRKQNVLKDCIYETEEISTLN